jgi:hypothetical protein
MPALKRSLLATLCILGCTLTANAAEKVSMWVDENGVTHFSNRQFAPENAEELTIKSTNGMDVPEPASTVAPTPSSGAAKWTKVELPAKQNPKGRRPMHESLYTGRKHQPGRRQ